MNNDELSGKTGKVKVMYVRPSSGNEPYGDDRRDHRGSSGGRREGRESGGKREGGWRERRDSGAKREGGWRERRDSGAKREGGWRERRDSGAKREGDWRERRDSGAKREGDWRERRDPGAKREGDWRERRDPGAKREGDWRERRDPGAKREGDWRERRDSGAKREGDWRERRDPGAKREGDWRERRDSGAKREGDWREKHESSGRRKDSWLEGRESGAKREGGWRERREPGSWREERKLSAMQQSQDDVGMFHEQDEGFSPWSLSSHALVTSDESAFDHGGISGKSDIDPELLRQQRTEETRVYGENACKALFTHRPEIVVRAWFLQEVTPRFRKALRWLAANRKAYHVVDSQEMAKVSGTEHHGGVCFLIKKRAGISLEQWLSQAVEKDCVVALEDIGNPHNIGAIMRSCAHFGVRGMVVQDVALLQSGAAVRTAEGGAEHVQPIVCDDVIAALKQFRLAGYTIIATSSHTGLPLFGTSLPEKMLLLLGQERDGVSSQAMALADIRIAINGTGNVESLNVSVAAGVLLGEWWRQQQ